MIIPIDYPMRQDIRKAWDFPGTETAWRKSLPAVEHKL